MNISPKKIGFIGGGQMAEALVRGIIASGLAEKDGILVVDPDPMRCAYLAETYDVAAGQDIDQLCASCSTLVAAIKPQVAVSVLAQYRTLITAEHLFISIMAGIRLHLLESLFERPVRIVRVMPNTPALVLAGASALSANSLATAEDRTLVMAIFSAVGICVEVGEQLLDAVTGLSGSGPGYVFTFLEAMIDGGVLAGLPRQVASQLALQTLYGSAKLALETGESAATLKGQVTSPGGTTITGLKRLETAAFRGAVMEAVEAATLRSRELGA